MRRSGVRLLSGAPSFQLRDRAIGAGRLSIPSAAGAGSADAVRSPAHASTHPTPSGQPDENGSPDPPQLSFRRFLRARWAKLYRAHPILDLAGTRDYSYASPDAGWSSLAARRAHNPKVAGSNPAPATRSSKEPSVTTLGSLLLRRASLVTPAPGTRQLRPSGRTFHLALMT